jgi:hypothetical protein
VVALINDMYLERAAVSLAWVSSVANEEVACPVAYRAAAPDASQFQGTSVPSGANALKGTGAPVAGFQRSGMPQIQADRTTVVDRSRLAVPGPAPRGRPV